MIIITIVIIISTSIIIITISIESPKDCSDVVKEVFVVKTVGRLEDDRGQKIVEEQLRSEPDHQDFYDDHDDQMMIKMK